MWSQVTSKLPSSFICPEHLLCMEHSADAGHMPEGVPSGQVCKAWKERQILEVTLLSGKLPRRESQEGTEAAGPQG